MKQPPKICSIASAFIRETEYERLLFHTYNNTALKQLKDATVFSIRTKKERVNYNARKTLKATFQSNNVWKIIDTSLQRYVNKQSWKDEWRMQLLGTDISYLQYRKGDYFNAHRDYTKMNVPNELYGYTLIVGLHEPICGGDTCIQKNDNETDIITWKASMGNMVLFDAMLKHWSTELLKGIKEVLVFDVWCVRKKQSIQHLNLGISELFQSRLHNIMNNTLIGLDNKEDETKTTTLSLFHSFLNGQDQFTSDEITEIRCTIDYVMCGLDIPSELSLPTLRSALLTMQHSNAIMWSTSTEESIALRKLFQSCSDVVEIVLLYVSVTHMGEDEDQYYDYEKDPVVENECASSRLSTVYLNGQIPIAMRNNWRDFFLKEYSTSQNESLELLNLEEIETIYSRYKNKPNIMSEMHATLFGSRIIHMTDISYDKPDDIENGIYDTECLLKIMNKLPSVLEATKNNLQHCEQVERYYTWLNERKIFYEDDCNDESGGVGGYYTLPYVCHNGYAVSAFINISE